MFTVQTTGELFFEEGVFTLEKLTLIPNLYLCKSQPVSS